MKKNIVQIITLSTLIFSQSAAFTMPPLLYSAMHKVVHGGSTLLSLLPTISMLGVVAQKKHLSLPDAPQEVIDFCHARLKLHKLAPERIFIKVDATSQSPASAFFSTGLVLSSYSCDTIQKAVKDNSPENSYSLSILTLILDHEIGHLKKNDTARQIAFSAAINLALYKCFSELTKTNPLKFIYATPTSFKELIASTAILTASAVVQLGIFAGCNLAFTRYTERAADDYSFTVPQTPESLLGYALFNEKLYANWLQEQKIYDPNVQISPYTQFMYDPTHPSPLERVEKALIALEKIDADKADEAREALDRIPYPIKP